MRVRRSADRSFREGRRDRHVDASTCPRTVARCGHPITQRRGGNMGSAAKSMVLSAGAIAVLFAVLATAELRPSKHIEFFATVGPGGGTDNLVRVVQNSIVKHKLTDESVVVVNKGGRQRGRWVHLRQGVRGGPI